MGCWSHIRIVTWLKGVKMASDRVGSHYPLCSVFATALSHPWFGSDLLSFHLGRRQAQFLILKWNPKNPFGILYFNTEVVVLHCAWCRWRPAEMVQYPGSNLAQPNISLSSNQSKLLIRRPHFSKWSAARRTVLGSPGTSLWSISSFLLHSCLCHISSAWKTAEETSLFISSLGWLDT